MDRDPIILGGLAGLAGGTAMAVLSHLAFQLGLANVSTLHYAQRVSMHVAAPFTTGVLLVAFIGCVMMGSLFGVILVYIYRFTSTAFGHLKGAGFGFLNQYLLCNFVVPVALPEANLPQTAATTMMFFAVHLVYGLVTAHVILRYGHPSVLTVVRG